MIGWVLSKLIGTQNDRMLRRCAPLVSKINALEGAISSLSDDELKNKTPNPSPTDNYLMGYQEGVKKKIIRNSLLSAGVGFLAGFIIIVAAN